MSTERQESAFTLRVAYESVIFRKLDRICIEDIVDALTKTNARFRALGLDDPTPAVDRAMKDALIKVGIEGTPR